MATTPLHLPNNFLAVPSGLVVPPGYLSRSSAANEIEHAIGNYSHFAAGGFSFGTRLYRDPDTLVIRWAPKGSGIDDKLLAAIADGEIANVGIAPVMFDQLSALIKRRQEQVNSASVVVTGRTTPATRALNALARMRRILYGLDVFNRGALIATVPITYPVDQWSQHGMTLRPILDAAGQESDKFYLEVDWRGRSPVPYLPSIFDLEPTGNSQWPYWYRITLDGVKRWVLLHQSQIITLLSAETNRPGIGTSPVWICLPVMAENTLVIDERYARLIDRPTQGILTISGVTQSAETIRAKLDEPDQSWTLLAAPNPITVDGYSFRQPDDIDPVKRQGHFEDVLAADPTSLDSLASIFTDQNAPNAVLAELFQTMDHLRSRFNISLDALPPRIHRILQLYLDARRDPPRRGTRCGADDPTVNQPFTRRTACPPATNQQTEPPFPNPIYPRKEDSSMNRRQRRQRAAANKPQPTPESVDNAMTFSTEEETTEILAETDETLDDATAILDKAEAMANNLSRSTAALEQAPALASSTQLAGLQHQVDQNTDQVHALTQQLHKLSELLVRNMELTAYLQRSLSRATGEPTISQAVPLHGINGHLDGFQFHHPTPGAWAATANPIDVQQREATLPADLDDDSPTGKALRAQQRRIHQQKQS